MTLADPPAGLPEVARRLKPGSRVRGTVDVATVGLLLAMYAGLAVAYVGHDSGRLPAAATVVVGFLALNLSFTVWHEAIHGNVARNRTARHVLGRAGAVPTFVPFSRLRVHHLLHHRHTNDPERDPDRWQLDGSFWTLALRYPAGERRARRIVQDAGLSGGARAADAVQIGGTAAAVVALALAGPWSVVWVLLVPRALLVYTHALTVNYLPHAALPTDPHAGTRALLFPGWVGLLTGFQTLHAVHHLWPAVPWYRLVRSWRDHGESLVGAGLPSAGPSAALRLIGPTRPAHGH